MLQHALLTPHSPLEKTPHKAGVVGVPRVWAVAALFDMTAERSRAAGLDGAHDFMMCQRQGMCRTVSCAVLPKNVGHFKSGLWHRSCYLCGWGGGLLLLAALFFFAGFTSASSGPAVSAMTCVETRV